MALSPEQNTQLEAIKGKALKIQEQIKTLPTSKPKGAPVISADTLGNTTPVTLPQPDTSYLKLDALNASVGGTAQPEQPQQNDRQKLIGTMLGGIERLGQKGQAQEQAYQEAGVDPKQLKLNEIEARELKRDRYYENELRALEDKGGGLAMGMEAERNNLQRNRARELADIAIEKAVALDDYNTAVSIANRKVDAEFEPLEKQLQYTGQVYNMMQNDMTESEKMQAQEKIDEKKTNVEFARTTVQDTIATLIDAGAYTTDKQYTINSALVEATKAIENGEDPSEAIGKIQSTLSGVQSLAQQNIALQRAQEARLRAENAPTQPYSGEFSNVVDIASGLVGAERGKLTKSGITNALSSGDYGTAYALIGNNVEESLTGETKSRFANARTDYEVMSGMRDAIQEYAAAGGDLGFLKGTANEITRKLGQLTSDPKFATLAVQLNREFQAYRQQMTGAAFGANESAEYQSVNPRTNASLDLNLATIDGALNQLENRITSTVKARVPGSDQLYAKVRGETTEDASYDPQTAPVGSIVEIGGVKYKKTGDNEYIEA